MELLANDRSVHEQFHNLEEFGDALSQLMAMRNIAKQFRHEVQCHGAFLNTRPIPNVPIQQAIGNLEINDKRAAMAWLNQVGPFWDKEQRHSLNDWLECNGEIVTETAVGEAAFRKLSGVNCGLISIYPSDNWNTTPINVTWNREAEDLINKSTEIDNWWDPREFESGLQSVESPIDSWKNLCDVSKRRFTNLTFTKECFYPLKPVPFSTGSAKGFITLFDVLDKYAQAFDEKGDLTQEGHEINDLYFVGRKARFSDSSEAEIRKFRQELTFGHPENSANSIFCPWHGKVHYSTLPLRFHFSWPIRPEEPVYIVYAGPKITKR